MAKDQSIKDEEYRARNADEMGYKQIKIWVREDEAEAIKAKYKAIRQADRAKLKKVQEHKAKTGKRPAHRKTNAEKAQDERAKIVKQVLDN